MFRNLFEFYRSKEWEEFRNVVMSERIKDDGHIYDEETGKPIVKAYDIILHHKEELTEENVNDYNISLNPSNIMIVSQKTHNLIHNKLGYKVRQVYIVYGAPLSGKTTYVNENKLEGDLVVDIDNIWQMVSGCDRYVKPNRLKSVVFSVRDTLIDSVKYRRGKWCNAWVIGGYALQGERERLAAELGAREIYIDTTREECLERLKESDRDADEWREYIERWFELYERSGV